MSDIITKDNIDSAFLSMVDDLETEYFDIVDEVTGEGIKVGQHRELRKDKTLEAFNATHGQIWKEWKAALIGNGLAEPDPEPEPVRNLQAEIDELKNKISELEAISLVK